tara:strand:+ start:1916 stop:2062 length:147 start_codon:yes stop_codon:yes gene_type:complete
MENDPAETTNLQPENPEVVKGLKALLERYKKSGRSVSRGRAGDAHSAY